MTDFFFVKASNDVCKKKTDVTFSVSYELSHPIGKTEFYSIAKICLVGKKMSLIKKFRNRPVIGPRFALLFHE